MRVFCSFFAFFPAFLQLLKMAEHKKATHTQREETHANIHLTNINICIFIYAFMKIHA